MYPLQAQSMEIWGGGGEGVGERKHMNHKSLLKAIDNKKCFNFSAICLYIARYFSTQLFRIHNGEIILSLQEAIFAIDFAVIGIVAPTLSPIKSELGEDVAIYNLQGVMRQLGYDQGSVRVSRDTGTSNALVAEARREGKGQFLASFDKVFWLAFVIVGMRSQVVRYMVEMH